MRQNNLSQPRQFDRTEIILYSSFLILLLSLTSMNLFIADFRISLGVIFLAIFLFLIPRFPMIPVTIICAVGILVVRSVFTADPSSFVAQSLPNYLPEAVFYLAYGLVLNLLYHKFEKQLQSTPLMILTLAVLDYLCNSLELVLRLQGAAFTADYQLALVVVAVIRAVVAWFVVFFFSRYRVTLLQQSRDRVAEMTRTVQLEMKELESVQDQLTEARQTALAIRKGAGEKDPELEALSAQLIGQLEGIRKSHRVALQKITREVEKGEG